MAAGQPFLDISIYSRAKKERQTAERYVGKEETHAGCTTSIHSSSRSFLHSWPWQTGRR
jgi:hypothetical protein